MIRGFTMIECLMGIALIALLVMSSHASIIAIASATGEAEEEALLLREAMLIRERIRDEVRASSAVHFGDGSMLVLDQEGGQATFAREAAAIVFAYDSIAFDVTAPEVAVTAFTVRPSPRSQNPDGLDVAFELSTHAQSGTAVSRTFAYRFYP